MYPSRRTSGQALLPAGPSAGSHQWTAGDVDLEDIVVDTPSNDSQESTLSVAVPKPRPLNLADNYELVGGVPAFVWKPSREYKPVYQVYAISSDGTRMAIKEEWRKICVYDMLDNFSLVAEWEDVRHKDVETFTFHNNQNNELVVAFEDATVALMSLSHKSKDGAEQTNIRQQHIGELEIKQKFRILNEFEDIERLLFFVYNYGLETWVCPLYYNIRKIVTLCSIEEGRYRRLEIKSDGDIAPTFVYCSIPQRAVMLVTTNYNGTAPLHTRIWTDLNFDNEINEESPIELRHRQGFDFSECGSYFLTWYYGKHSENAIEVYDVRLFKTSTNPIATISIGTDVLRARAQFVQVDKASLEVLGIVRPEKSLIAAFLVASSNKVELTLWDILPNKVFKTLNVTMKEMTLSDPFHVEFCISPNMKWVALASWTDGVVGLFSLLNGTLLWSVKLDTSESGLLDEFIPLKFDVSSSRLTINACDTLYVFAPSCLIHDYELEIKSTSIDLLQDFRDSKPPLDIHHQTLLPKHIFKQVVFQEHGSEMQYHNGVLDVANSRISSNIALLIQTDKWFTIVQVSFETLFASSFKEYIESDWSHAALPNGVVELRLDTPPLQQPQDFAFQQKAWIFLHPNEDVNEDSTAIFLTQNGFQGVFIDIKETRNQVRTPFGSHTCFAMKQSKDGNIVVCLHTSGVMTIDLNKKSILYQVSYGANLAQWLVPYIATRNQSCFDVSCDATSILIGWDMKNKRPRLLTSQMDDEECKGFLEKDEDIVPCWWINESSTIFAFLEFDDEDHAVSAICLCNCESNALKRINIGQWNLHIKQVLGSMHKNSMHEHALHFDQSNGHLWIIALHERDDAPQLTFVPLNSYSHENCIPCLSMKEYLIEETGRLEELTSQFGLSLFNILFNGKTNLEYAFDYDDKNIITRVCSLALHCGVSSHELLAQGFGKRTSADVFRNAIWNKDKVVVDFILTFLDEKSTSFESQAFVLKEGFEGLWMNYQSIFTSKIVNNSIARKVCEIEVPLEVFVDERYSTARLGTLDSIPSQWEDSFNSDMALEHWRLLHQEDLQEIEKRGIKTTVTAIVMFFAIESSCKVGLNGLIRFLLMQEAPFYIFKSPLLKWVLEFKWKRVWQTHSRRSLMFHLFFASLYAFYSICIAFVSKDFHKHISTSVLLTIILFVLTCIASRLLYQEYVQIRTYIQDGKKLFPNDSTWGLRKYWSSPWNVVEVFSYLVLMIVIPILHFVNLGNVDILLALHAFVALEALLIWIKVWYYVQAFKRTGAFVLMIENIVKDCVPFLALSFAILVGFSLALFVLFQHSLQEKRVIINDGEEDEVKADLARCFGDPAKAMVTLFYAMIGTFEPKVYYHSGSLSPIITFAFVVYLAIQMIVMVNMLIAIMGDTFDRVISTEEEQLLLGRLRFIDACEAQLSKKEIEQIEVCIGKFLYVLLPKDKDITEDIRLWQGRVKEIEERVGKMIMGSQKAMMDQMKADLNEIMKIKEDTNDLKQIKEDADVVKEDIDNIKEDTNNIKEDISSMKEDVSSMKEDMTDMKEVLQLIKDKVLE